MSSLILIRHGETDFNLQRRYCGVSNPGLNSTGIRQAELLAIRLENERIAKVYCSDRKRAVQTAKIIFKGKGIEKISELCEMNFGVFEGMKYEELIEKYGETYINWINNPMKDKIPNGENLIDFKARVKSGLTSILAQHKGTGENIAIVTHEGPIRIISSIDSRSPHVLSGEREFIIKKFWHIKQPLGSFRIVNYE